eukprot:Nk52_evm86s208 gene=Nk52_evmTU86s208
MDKYKAGFTEKGWVGVCKQDIACQTDASEVLEIKNITNTFKVLRSEVYDMKHALAISSHALKVDYRRKIGDSVTSIYDRVHRYFDSVENELERRINRIRAACRAQLFDFAARSTCEQQNKLSKMLEELSVAREQEIEAMNVEKQHLKVELIKKNDMLSRLEERLREVEGGSMMIIQEETKPEDLLLDESMDGGKGTKSKWGSARGVVGGVKGFGGLASRKQSQDEQMRMASKHHSDILRLEEELKDSKAMIDALIDEKQALERGLEKLQIQIQQQEAEAKALSKEANKSKQGEIDNLEAMCAELMKQVEHLKEDLHDEQELFLHSERKKKGLELRVTNLENTIKQREEHIDELKKGQKTEIDEIALTKLERHYVSEISVIKTQHNFTIDRLTAEFAKKAAIWEKKLLISQQALHAVKDESYLRTMLVKQSNDYLRNTALVYPTLKAGPGMGEGYGQIMTDKNVTGGADFMGMASSVYAQQQQQRLASLPTKGSQRQGKNNRPKKTISAAEQTASKSLGGRNIPGDPLVQRRLKNGNVPNSLSNASSVNSTDENGLYGGGGGLSYSQASSFTNINDGFNPPVPMNPAQPAHPPHPIRQKSLPPILKQQGQSLVDHVQPMMSPSLSLAAANRPPLEHEVMMQSIKGGIHDIVEESEVFGSVASMMTGAGARGMGSAAVVDRIPPSSSTE